MPLPERVQDKHQVLGRIGARMSWTTYSEFWLSISRDICHIAVVGSGSLFRLEMNRSFEWMNSGIDCYLLLLISKRAFHCRMTSVQCFLWKN
jgi:hypothetical protein